MKITRKYFSARLLLLPLFLVVFTLWPGISQSQKRAIDAQPSEYLVNDYAGVLERQEVIRLGQQLRSYALETSTQIAVVTENSLQGDDPFDYTIQLAQKWGIGGQQDNGVLIYIAVQDRKIAFQVGYGAEGFLPDAMANRIITEIMQPAFRAGRYYEGLDRAAQAVMDLGRGEYTNEGGSAKRKATGLPLLPMLFLVIIVMIILARLFGGRGDDDDDDGGYYRGGRYDYPQRRRGRRRRGGGWIFLPGPIGGWSGGGGSGGGDGFGGFGGGGFGGFGGGDFGGGGAIGDW